ncbi:MAG: hypothetical protein WAT71_18120, partial [Ignavibacteria bacterium]
LNKLVEKDSLSDKDKDRVFDLLNEYKKTLDETIRGNRDLKKMMIGASSVIALSFVYIIYKSVGGKGGEQILANAPQKLLNI